MSTNERSAAAPGGPEVGVTAPGVQGSGPRHGHVHPADGETTALADDARHDPGDRAGAHDHAAQDHAAQDHAGHDHADADDHAGHDHGAHAGHDHTGHDHADADDHAGHGHGGHDHRGHAGHDHGGTGDHAGHDDADHGDHAGHDHADADDHAGHDHDHGGHDHDHDHGGHGHDHPGGVKGLILSLVRPHSHDAADSFDATLEASAEGMRTLKISLAGLAVTAVVQLVIFTVSGSVALLADLIHNFADALTAVPLAAAFVLSRRPATRQYTYGYGRSEDLAGVFIVATITASSALAAWEAIHRLIHPAHVHQVGWVIVAGLVGFVGNEAVAHYRITVGRRIGSAALEADGYHARTDGFTSLAVVVGAIGVAAGWQLADPIIGLVITVAILAVVRNAARDIYRRLMDAVDPALVARVTSILEGVEGIDGVDAVRIRWVGHELWAEAEVTADGDRSLADVHELTEAAHHDLLHRVPRLSQATIHAGPTVAAGADPHELTSHHRPPHR